MSKLAFARTRTQRFLFPLAISVVLVGCTSPWMLYDKPDTVASIAAVDEDLFPETRLIKDVTRPWGTNFIKVEGVAMVNALQGTGCDPAPCPQRSALIAEMQTHKVKKPNMWLASTNTAMAYARAYLPPGVQKGDRIDVEIRVPSRSETTSLHGGFVMKTRMREVAILDSTLHTGRVDGLAEGPIVLDSVVQGGGDDISEVRGRIIGGGVATNSRPLGLAVSDPKSSIKTASLVGAEINSRFHTYERGTKVGVATPKRNDFVELKVHPRYKNNLARYMRVIRNIAVDESPAKRLARVELLEQKLLEPATSASAAIQLEAIGKEASSPLRRGIQSDNLEVRFYAAEALAYMNEPEASDPLREAAEGEPAFRWHAIGALAALDHISAHDALTELLHVPSAETRYAAFRALKTRNSLDLLVRGESIGKDFSYHAITSSGPPMIHFSVTKYPEMVVFGGDQHIEPPAFIFAGKNIMVKRQDSDQIRVMRFAAEEEDKHEICTTSLYDVVRTIVKMGGKYEDIVQFTQEAKDKNYIESRVVVNALPQPNRVYRREEGTDEALAQGEPKQERATSPLPDIFVTKLWGQDDDRRQDDEEIWDIELAAAEEGRNSKGFFGKLGTWFTGE